MLRGPAGDERVLAGPPRRIASTYLAADELLAALVHPDRVVGVSAYVNDPAASNSLGVYPAAVARLRADPETIVALEPDLVCVASFTARSVPPAHGLRPTVARWSRFDSFADVMEEIRMLGAAVGEEPAPTRGGRHRGAAARSRTPAAADPGARPL